MRTVYIIGAGCTRNYKPDSPLDRTFFESCNKILLDDDQLTNRFLPLIKHLDSLFGLKLGVQEGSQFSILGMPTLEQVTTILDLESGDRQRQYMDSFVNLICIVFHRVLEGQISEIHEELADRVKPNDVIISYNYDIVMDNSLMVVKGLDDRVYRFNFHQRYYGKWKPFELKSAPISLLKLHGSMNWLECNSCHALLFYWGMKAASELAYQVIGINNHQKRLACPVCKTERLKPLLIPPLMSKDRYLKEYQYLWQLAEKSIVLADRVVVIGYSLPSTDFYSELMFRRAMTKRPGEKPSLSVVDKNDRIPARFESVFGAKASYSPNLRDYLDRTVE